MKVLYIVFVLFFFRETNAATVVRKPPAFSTQIYSDSYLPAAMQVILHAVDQLKVLAEPTNSTLTASSTSQPTSTTSQPTSTTTNTVAASVTTSSTSTSPEMHEEKKPESSTEMKIDVENEMTTEPTKEKNPESTETNQETPETNYATPEANYETPEDPHATQETNHELDEENHEENSSKQSLETTSPSSPSTVVDSKKRKPCEDSKQADTEESKKKRPTIDSVVEGIYEIVKPTSSDILENDGVDESKSPSGMSPEKMENLEDELEETRFTLLGEKVAQVARPTLISYLKRTKLPLSASLQKLATLYDALSKDARKQGYAKYTGYSDEVLKVLAASGEDGIGSQLKILLKKVLERNELTRDDARMKTTAMMRDLDDDSGELSKDLKSLSPLRYVSE